MPHRSKYRLRVAGLFGAMVGLVAVLPAAPVGTADRAELQSLSVSEKLAAIREATSLVIERARVESANGAEAVENQLAEHKLLAQWFNWANWRNWANWANWANWGNVWGNY